MNHHGVLVLCGQGDLGRPTRAPWSSQSPSLWPEAHLPLWSGVASAVPPWDGQGSRRPLLPSVSLSKQLSLRQSVVVVRVPWAVQQFPVQEVPTCLVGLPQARGCQGHQAYSHGGRG